MIKKGTIPALLLQLYFQNKNSNTGYSALMFAGMDSWEFRRKGMGVRAQVREQEMEEKT